MLNPIELKLDLDDVDYLLDYLLSMYHYPDDKIEQIAHEIHRQSYL